MARYKDIKNTKIYLKSKDSRLEAESLRQASGSLPRPAEKAWGQKSNEVIEIIRPEFVTVRSRAKIQIRMWEPQQGKA